MSCKQIYKLSFSFEFNPCLCCIYIEMLHNQYHMGIAKLFIAKLSDVIKNLDSSITLYIKRICTTHIMFKLIS